MRVAVLLSLMALLALGACLDSASRTQRIPPSGKCDPKGLLSAGAPGEECVVAEDCSAFCCFCEGAGGFEAQLCLGGACADATTTCEDAAANAALCQ